MNHPKDGGAAFPVPAVNFVQGNEGIHYPPHARGMSLRDYFAAKAMQALVASGDFGGFVKHRSAVDIECMTVDTSITAYQIADAMIAARGGKANG